MIPWRSEDELRAAVTAIARAEAVAWPADWRALLGPLRADDHLRQIEESGRVLLAAIDRFVPSLHADGADESAVLLEGLASFRTFVEERTAVASAAYRGTPRLRGRLPERARSFVAHAMTSCPTRHPTARELALVSLVAGTPITSWRIVTVGEAIKAEARAMRAHRARRSGGHNEGVPFLSLPPCPFSREFVA